MVKIDLTAVQGWYSAAFKPGDAPAMWGTPGGKSVSDGWVGGSKAVSRFTPTSAELQCRVDGVGRP